MLDPRVEPHYVWVPSSDYAAQKSFWEQEPDSFSERKDTYDEFVFMRAAAIPTHEFVAARWEEWIFFGRDILGTLVRTYINDEALVQEVLVELPNRCQQAMDEYRARPEIADLSLEEGLDAFQA